MFSNSTGNGITGDQVAVYQDTYLELSETKDNLPEKEEASLKNTTKGLELIKDVKEKTVFKANRPFLFVFAIESHIVALGRVKDPSWCKLCDR